MTSRRCDTNTHHHSALAPASNQPSVGRSLFRRLCHDDRRYVAESCRRMAIWRTTKRTGIRRCASPEPDAAGSGHTAACGETIRKGAAGQRQRLRRRLARPRSSRRWREHGSTTRRSNRAIGTSPTRGPPIRFSLPAGRTPCPRIVHDVRSRPALPQRYHADAHAADLEPRYGSDLRARYRLVRTCGTADSRTAFVLCLYSFSRSKQLAQLRARLQI